MYRKYRIKDMLCGLKGYRLKSFPIIDKKSKVHSIGTRFAVYGVQSGVKFTTMSIKVNDRSDSSRFGGNILANIKILKALLWIMMGEFKKLGHSKEKNK